MFKTYARGIAATVLAVTTVAAAWAADASGKWTWTRKFQNNEVTQTLELKQDGEKLTGTITGRNADQKTEIKDGKIKDNEISFNVVRERNGQEFKMAYKGKIDGDTIKGEQVFNGQNGERKVAWEAKRAK